MVRRTLAVLALLVPTLASAQSALKYPDAEGCIGGERCGGSEASIRIALEKRPVVSIRFVADDDIGSSANGKLRVRIDQRVIERALDIPREGSRFTLDVDRYAGAYLYFEPASADEINVSGIDVVYGSATPGGSSGGATSGSAGGPPTFSPAGPTSSDGWIDASKYDACIGGERCSKGSIRIPLDARPVIGIRFRAHDDVGSRSEGKLQVRIDDTVVATNVDVKRDGKLHEFPVNGISGKELRIEATTKDEVVVEKLEIRLGQGLSVTPVPGWGSGGVPEPVEVTGGCIGGRECGGNLNVLRIPLKRRSVMSVQFFAHDNVGDRSGGKLRVRIDETVLETSLDILKEGREYTLDARNIRGRELVFEPVANDEVKIERIVVTYGRR